MQDQTSSYDDYEKTGNFFLIEREFINVKECEPNGKSRYKIGSFIIGIASSACKNVVWPQILLWSASCGGEGAEDWRVFSSGENQTLFVHSGLQVFKRIVVGLVYIVLKNLWSSMPKPNAVAGSRNKAAL